MHLDPSLAQSAPPPDPLDRSATVAVGASAGKPAERPCWLDVDLDAVASNVRALRARVGDRTAICAVVKADAYGLGARAVADAALRAGAERVAVARVDEAVRLRRAGVGAPILLIAGFTPDEAATIVRERVTPTVVQASDALALGRAAGRVGATLPVHVKVDTGLTRYGASAEEALALCRLIEGLPTLRLEGVYTHFAAAEDDAAFTRRQLDRFHAFVAALGAFGIRPPLVHAANSASALTLPDAHLDMVRAGIALSGADPLAGAGAEAPLAPAVALRARLLRVQAVEPGATIGYGRTFSARRPMRVGLAPAGYADGVPRAHSNRAFALVRGARVRLVGRVSMDQCVVDLTDVPDARLGDVVTLFGAADGDRISLEEFASWSDTIPHEALCRVGPRVPRRYAEAGRAWWAREAWAGAAPAFTALLGT